jgi:O-antigen ligase
MKSVSIILLFTLFLQPFHYGPASANYLFILFPFFVILSKQRIIIPSKSILITICLFTFILILGFISQPEYLQYALRRMTSFILYMLMFSFLFIPINEKLVYAFKISIIVASLFVMLPFIFHLMSLGTENLGWSSKSTMGAQRYGFIYIMAFWLVLMFKSKSKFITLLKFVLLPTIITGILILFNRSSIVSLIVSMIIYFLYKTMVYKSTIRRKIAFTFLSIVTVYAIYQAISIFAPFIITFFDRRLFSVFADLNLTRFNLEDENGSEGYRIFMFKTIIEFVSNHLFTGSGFLGVWVLFSDLSGSTHNQYTDMLFRTGLLGFLAYLYLIIRIVNYTYRQHKDLFFGLVGVIIFGLFNETFKLSHGGFIFAFLLALSFQKNKKLSSYTNNTWR